jgi:ABC-type antimicrobial peptide transport system permease subunit
VRPHPGEAAATLAPALTHAVSQADPDLPVYFGGTPAVLHAQFLVGNRLIANLFTIFGLVAVVLSAVGLYGVMSFSVNQRTQEFGIRMALGADARRILRLVMTQGAWQVAIGLTLGAGSAALLLGALGQEGLQNFLFQVDAHDPVIYSSVAMLLILVAAASCLVPALRATRVNPMVALRAE